MPFRHKPVRTPSLRILLPLSLALLLVLRLAASFSGVSAHREEPAQSTLRFAIPYHAAHAGAGRLTVELLDPEDHVLGTADSVARTTPDDGTWQISLKPSQAIAYDDVIWQRVRYRFDYSDHTPSIEGIDAVSEILRRPVVRVLGQTDYIAGSSAALRVIVTDANADDANSTPETGTLRIDLLSSADANAEPHATPLFAGKLNARGTLEAPLHFPANITGSASLRFTADTPIGTAEYTQPITLAEKSSILLTTEKPLYQPGQTIHVRALALNRADHTVVNARPITFEVEDSRGNKVFKHATSTDAYGVASAEFTLADEVNLGTYHLRALLGSPPTSTAELAMNVERYVLPKFKVSVDFTEGNGKPRRDYRPGDHVTGIVHANYFFGKPVDHAEVKLKVSGADVQVFEAASATGKTDADGAYHFDLKLPAYFAGKPLSGGAQGAARALIEATVKDSADHSETRGEPITVSQTSLLVQAIPEGGTLVPHLDNQVFILTSYPDGTPARSTVNVKLPGGRTEQATTDASGVAVIHFTPESRAGILFIDADDHHGNHIKTDAPLKGRDGDDQVLLRTDRAVVKAGDTLHLKVLSTRATGTAYVDIVRAGQTIVTRDLDLHNGEADLNITATPAMAGTLDLDAYVFGHDAQPVADHRLVFVQPADELHVEASTDAPVYKPGADANIRFHVTNARGQGVSAALGLQIVDEAVFALAEKQPGFAKVFFYLEQEVMKPRYEIHSLSINNAVEPSGGGQDDLAARALFSATELAAPAKLDAVFGHDLPEAQHAAYVERYQAALHDQVQKLAAQITSAYVATSAARVKEFNRMLAATRDAWGTPLRVQPQNWRGKQNYYLVSSAGPDHRFDTGDELSVYVEEHTGNIVRHPGANGRADFAIEHDRGPANGRAEFTGVVNDPSGATIPGATVTLRLAGEPAARTTHTDRTGSFTLTGLTPGRYTAQLAMPGFESLTQTFTVEPRDRATLTAVLMLGSVSETVEVSDATAIATDTMQFEAMPRPMMLDGVAAPAKAPPAGRAMAGMAMGAISLNGRELERKESYTLREPTSSAAAEPATHVRSYFPEALYINPEIITDARGNASITIPVADSITTWRMAMLASTKDGAIGTGTSSLKVFQDFFVDLDLPVTLTQGDRVSIPLGIYNYTGKRGDVALSLQPDAWYSLADDSASKSVAVDSRQVGAAHFSINANRIGKFKLTLTAHMQGSGRQASRDDIIVREIDVVPNGKESDTVANGRLDSSAQHAIAFAADAIPDASSIVVRLYPGPMSQLVEGMDSLLRMPYGCFEQTSSSTYPNVLALDYMKRTKKLTPEVHAKAEGYIANGYQRLLTFEVPGGGFSWFGSRPANKILTAYGLMEFNDMAQVSDVDPRLITRTRDWLISQQQADGSWKPDTSFINEGATTRFNTNVLRITAYVAWSLANTGYRGPALDRAAQYIQQHFESKPDIYTLAVLANFSADYAGKSSGNESARNFERRAMQALVDARTEQGDQAFWSADETAVYATGKSAAIETTGLAAQALFKWGQASEVARKALAYIAANKSAQGDWGTTQATITSLRALLLATQFGAADTRGTVQIKINNHTVQTLALTSDNNDLLHQFVFKNIDAATNNVQLTFSGKGSLAYQVVGRSFRPWNTKPAQEALAISVTYDRTRLAANDIVSATATVHNNTHATANMVMVDLGIPPGFDLQSEDLQTMIEKTSGARAGKLEKFSQTATQAILYFNALGPDQTVLVHFRLRAKYPIKAKTFESKVYEYYDPAVTASAAPAQFEVTGK